MVAQGGGLRRRVKPPDVGRTAARIRRRAAGCPPRAGQVSPMPPAQTLRAIFPRPFRRKVPRSIPPSSSSPEPEGRTRQGQDSRKPPAFQRLAPRFPGCVESWDQWERTWIRVLGLRGGRPAVGAVFIAQIPRDGKGIPRAFHGGENGRKDGARVPSFFKRAPGLFHPEPAVAKYCRELRRLPKEQPRIPERLWSGRSLLSTGSVRV